MTRTVQQLFDLKGKTATFNIVVHAVKVAGETVVDEDFAKELGLESPARLRRGNGHDAIKLLLECFGRAVERELRGVARHGLKIFGRERRRAQRHLAGQDGLQHDLAVPRRCRSEHNHHENAEHDTDERKQVALLEGPLRRLMSKRDFHISPPSHEDEMAERPSDRRILPANANRQNAGPNALNAQL